MYVYKIHRTILSWFLENEKRVWFDFILLWQVTLMIHFSTRRLRLKVAIVPIFLLKSMGRPEVSSPFLHPLMLRLC
jgi:hypothetical protein